MSIIHTIIGVIAEDDNNNLIYQIEMNAECRCGSSFGIVYTKGQHYRLDCGECGRYIKFIPKAELVDKLQGDKCHA